MARSHKDCGLSHYSYLVVYILSLQVLNTNTRSSAHWKLIVEDGKHVISPNPNPGLTLSSSRGAGALFSEGVGQDEGGNDSYVNNMNSRSSQRQRHGTSATNTASVRKSQNTQYWSPSEENDELVLRILSTTVLSPKGLWTKNGHEYYCSNCPVSSSGGRIGSSTATSNSGSGQRSPIGMSSGSTATISASSDLLGEGHGQEILDCGRPANFTYYDQLIGVANRQSHPHIPEPQVAMVFRKKGSKKDTIDLNTLERKLRKAKKEKPSSVQLYNQIGNFWRIKGNTLRAIECFRRALAVAPNNPEVLHNLARLLLTLQYLDDALFLARRSLELQAPDRSAWQQHFTLGEILKAYGHHQEAVLHFKHTLELRPDHSGAQDALRELETLLAGTGLHICTLMIIIFLVLGVLLVMLSSLENDDGQIPDLSSRPPPRHFSRALALRKLLKSKRS